VTTVKIWLGNLLVALAFGGLLATSNIGQAGLDFPLNALAAAAAIIATTSVGLLGRRLAMTGRKQRAAQTAASTANDPRPPVVYLRSFATQPLPPSLPRGKSFKRLSTVVALVRFRPDWLPEFLPNAPVMIGEAFLAPKIAYGALIAVVLIGMVLLLFRFWRGGVALRATASDQAAAYSMGINVPRVFSLAWVASAMIAAVAGIIVGAIGGISSSMGVFGLSVLVVVIVGGLDSVLGALVGGLFIGLVEALAGSYLGGEYKLLATFIVLVLVLMVRPYGLFGTREIERL